MKKANIKKEIEQLKKECWQQETKIIFKDKDDIKQEEYNKRKKELEELNKQYEQTLESLQKEYTEILKDERTSDVIKKEIEEKQKQLKAYQEENQKLENRYNYIKNQKNYMKNPNYPIYYNNMVYYWPGPQGMYPYFPQQFYPQFQYQNQMNSQKK